MTDFSKQEMDILKNSTLLNHIADEHFQAFMSISSRVTYPEGAVLLEEGEQSDNFFIIISGAVGLYKQENKTSKPELIATLNGGETIGEMRIIQNRACSLTVKSSQPVVALCASITQLREIENHLCYEAILGSIITIINKRFCHSNETVLSEIHEKKRKNKQLVFSMCSIFVLILFLCELGLAVYYTAYSTDFCNTLNVTPH